MSNADADYDDAGFVVASAYRVAVLAALRDGPRTPTGIKGEADVALAHVSRALAQCRDKDMVKLLVDEDRKKGRVYGLTDRGESAIERAIEVSGGEP